MFIDIGQDLFLIGAAKYMLKKPDGIIKLKKAPPFTPKRHAFPDSVFVISIPFDLFGPRSENLQHLEWVLPKYIQDRDTNAREFVELIQALEKESQA